MAATEQAISHEAKIDRRALIIEEAQKIAKVIAPNVLDLMGVIPGAPYFTYQQVKEAAERSAELTAEAIFIKDGYGYRNTGSI